MRYNKEVKIQEIFDRFELTPDIRENSLSHAAFVSKMHNAWLGPTLDWTVLIKAALFYDLGTQDLSAKVRKKAGLDKFTISIIERGVGARVIDIQENHSWYELLHLYGVLSVHSQLKDELSKQLISLVEENLLFTRGELFSSISEKDTDRLLKFDIVHYKNPSV